MNDIINEEGNGISETHIKKVNAIYFLQVQESIKEDNGHILATVPQIKETEPEVEVESILVNG